MSDKFQGNNGTIYLRGVPTHIRNDFAAAVARRGKKMKPIFVQFMIEFAKRERELNAMKTATEKTVEKFRADKIVKIKRVKK